MGLRGILGSIKWWWDERVVGSVGVLGTQVLRLATSVPGEVRWQELTAPGDPLQLRVTHSLDAATSALTLQFQACNRLTVEIKNAGIK